MPDVGLAASSGWAKRAPSSRDTSLLQSLPTAHSRARNFYARGALHEQHARGRNNKDMSDSIHLS